MNLRLALLRIYLPVFVRKQKLRELFEITARAFGAEAPRLGGRSFGSWLDIYARFTCEKAEEALLRGKNVKEIETRLFTGTRDMGNTLRKQLRVSTREEFMAACTLLYRALEIDFDGNVSGEIVIRKCFFSSYYSGEVCRLISSIDAGIAAGLSGRGNLEFSQRITEGGDMCRAQIVFRDNLP